MPQTIPIRLQKLFNTIDACARCKAEKNPLRHVLGGGKFQNPKFCLLFINPTHKNQSSRQTYRGRRRYPFIGVRHLYKGLAEAGFVDRNLIEKMYRRGWQLEDEHRIEKSLRENGVYITNFVKCARPNPINPTKAEMRESLPVLAEELSILNPEYIITFGLLPLEVLADNSFRLKDILKTVKQNKYKPMLSIPLNGRRYKILPCYYPLGHGNPPKAQKILRHIKKHF